MNAHCVNFYLYICFAFSLQGADRVWAYVPDAVWYDYETVRTFLIIIFMLP